jgi:hypothetical protein
MGTLTCMCYARLCAGVHESMAHATDPLRFLKLYRQVRGTSRLLHKPRSVTLQCKVPCCAVVTFLHGATGCAQRPQGLQGISGGGARADGADTEAAAGT